MRYYYCLAKLAAQLLKCESCLHSHVTLFIAHHFHFHFHFDVVKSRSLTHPPRYKKFTLLEKKVR